MDTLQWAYGDAKENNGAPGIDGVTFDDIEKAGMEAFLEQIQNELVSGTYRPMRNRIKEIPKNNDNRDIGDKRSCGSGGTQTYFRADI